MNLVLEGKVLQEVERQALAGIDPKYYRRRRLLIQLAARDGKCCVYCQRPVKFLCEPRVIPTAHNASNYEHYYQIKSEGSRRTLEDGRTQVSDLVVTCGTLTTVAEFTTGDKASLRHVIQKLATRPRKEKTVLLVGLEKPARGQPSTTRVCVRSTKLDALEIAKAQGIELEVFTLTRIDELLAYCQNRTRTYTHRRT